MAEPCGKEHCNPCPDCEAAIEREATLRAALETLIETWKMDCHPENAGGPEYEAGWDDAEVKCAETLEAALLASRGDR